jgi:hypothetical protein
MLPPHNMSVAKLSKQEGISEATSIAGPIRNKLIVEVCDEVIAFWDGKSTGTKHSINYAKELGKPFQIISVGHIKKPIG